MNKELLKLFHSVYDTQIKKVDEDATNINILKLKRTIKNGYIVAPNINPSHELLDLIDEIVGISGEKVNSAFHKSWSIIRDTPIEILVTQQIVHYLTTYGFESLGVFDSDLVFIPNEEFDLPQITYDIPLVVINTIDNEEIIKRITGLTSGVALAKDTIEDIFTILTTLGEKTSRTMYKIMKNRELKSRLADRYNIVPTEPEEYLRYVISKLTNTSLLIKNKELYSLIASADGKHLDTLLKDAPVRLASIFRRYKPIFLALKGISKNKRFFNRLTKDAKRLHQPLSEDYMNSITAQIKSGTLNHDEFIKKLQKAPIVRKMRLASALSNMKTETRGHVYRIRNGKSFCTDSPYTGLTKEQLAIVDIAYNYILVSIANEMRKTVEHKTILIPDYISYGLPATEKQFVGNFPVGTNVKVPENMIVGVHWTNSDNRRIDLDLSSMLVGGRKIGWDGDYRTGPRSVMHSGDLTSAPKPNGAAELMLFQEDFASSALVMLNYFNFCKDDPVPTKLFVGKGTKEDIDAQYMIDVNRIVFNTIINIEKKQNLIGLVDGSGPDLKFYVIGGSLGDSISAAKGKWVDQTRNFLISGLKNAISLNTILELAGANVVTEIPENEEFAVGDFINLSPEVVTKNSFLELL